MFTKLSQQLAHTKFSLYKPTSFKNPNWNLQHCSSRLSERTTEGECEWVNCSPSRNPHLQPQQDFIVKAKQPNKHTKKERERERETLTIFWLHFQQAHNKKKQQQNAHTHGDRTVLTKFMYVLPFPKLVCEQAPSTAQLFIRSRCVFTQRCVYVTF